jgi:putative intracellular protease/amidase
LRQSLEARGVTITVLAPRAGWSIPKKYEGSRDPDVLADRSFRDIRPGDFDAIVFIPAGRPEFLAKSPFADIVRQRLQEQIDHGVCIATVQNSVAVLADHGFLKGQRAAAQEWITRAEWFDHGDVIWDTASPVVASGRDGRLLSARSFMDADALVDRLLRTIGKTAKR